MSSRSTFASLCCPGREDDLASTVERAATPLRIKLEARCATRRCFRAYEIAVDVDLFGAWMVEMGSVAISHRVVTCAGAAGYDETDDRGTWRTELQAATGSVRPERLISTTPGSAQASSVIHLSDCLKVATPTFCRIMELL
jgi:hypothetical protein